MHFLDVSCPPFVFLQTHEYFSFFFRVLDLDHSFLNEIHNQVCAFSLEKNDLIEKIIFLGEFHLVHFWSFLFGSVFYFRHEFDLAFYVCGLFLIVSVDLCFLVDDVGVQRIEKSKYLVYLGIYFGLLLILHFHFQQVYS